MERTAERRETQEGRSAVMVSITCPCVECRYNGARYKCTAKPLSLKYRNMATVNEGRVDMWICDKYELSEWAKHTQRILEKSIMADVKGEQD